MSERQRPKKRSVPTTRAAESGVSHSKASDPIAPAPADENPTSAPIGKAIRGSQRDKSRPRAARRMHPQAVKIGSRHDNQRGSQSGVENSLRALSVEFRQHIRSGENARKAAQKQVAQYPIVHLFAINLHGNHQHLHGDTADASAVPTAWAGVTCMNRMRTGAVITPAPTPVTPIATAMMKPRIISTGYSL